MKLVGSLIYRTTTRLDINFVVGILSKFMHHPCEGHWNVAKQFLKYLKDTQSYGIKYWDWLVTKCEKRIANWCLQWLSKGSRMTSIKSMLKTILVYMCLS